MLKSRPEIVNANLHNDCKIIHALQIYTINVNLHNVRNLRDKYFFKKSEKYSIIGLSEGKKRQVKPCTESRNACKFLVRGNLGAKMSKQSGISTAQLHEQK